MSQIHERQQAEVIYALNKEIDDLEKELRKMRDVVFVQMNSSLDNYRKVFNFLNNQPWYQCHHYQVQKFIDSFVIVHND